MSDSFVIICGVHHVVWQCPTCGIFATCPSVVIERQREVGGYHYCPNGHSWGWPEQGSELDRARRERDRLKQENARLEESVAQRDRWLATTETARVEAEAARKKAEGVAKRLKKRASAGTCPCCSRTFSNMSEHMKRQHPEYVAEQGAKVVPLKGARA